MHIVRIQWKISLNFYKVLTFYRLFNPYMDMDYWITLSSMPQLKTSLKQKSAETFCIANKVTIGTRDVSFWVRYKWPGLQNTHCFLSWQYSIYLPNTAPTLGGKLKCSDIQRCLSHRIHPCKSQLLSGLRLTSQSDLLCLCSLLFSYKKRGAANTCIPMDSVEFLCHILLFQCRQNKFCEVLLISTLDYILSKKRRIKFTMRSVNFSEEMSCTAST